MWSLPGGVSLYGETAAETTVRETEEECGLRVAVVRLLTVAENASLYNKDIVAFIYQCKRISGVVHPNGDDVIDTKWVPFAEALERYGHYAFPALKKYFDAGGTVD